MKNTKSIELWLRKIIYSCTIIHHITVCKKLLSLYQKMYNDNKSYKSLCDTLNIKRSEINVLMGLKKD